LSFVVATSDRGVEARALVLVQIITIIDDGQIDLGTLGGIVGFVQLQPALVNLRFELQHDV